MVAQIGWLALENLIREIKDFLLGAITREERNLEMSAYKILTN